MRLIYVCTGTKYSNWYVKNLDYMINTYSGLTYKERVVITEEKFEGVYNKLQMFDIFRDGENLYFDLDIIIKGIIPNLIREEFTILHAWWRPQHHTPLNSSIMSWTGDCSYIYNTFIEQPDYYQLKYHRGIDQFIYENIKYNLYPKVCNSFQYDASENTEYNICLFNQRKDLMLSAGWWNKYTIPPVQSV